MGPVRVGRSWGRAGAAPLVCAILLVFCAATLRAERLTVATYNVENYLSADRLVDGEFRRDYPKPEAAKQALRSVIRELGADILALQEMGPEPYLLELQRDLAAEGLSYPYHAILAAADPGRHVALLSRRPFLALKGHDDLEFDYFGRPERVKRGLLEARVHMGSTDVCLYVVHLKSRYTDRSDDPESGLRRMKEAAAIRERVLRTHAEPASARYLLVGDLNDAPRSKPLQRLTQRGATVLAHVLPAADLRGHTWTHFYRKEETYSRIDYVLVSPGLKDAVVGGRARVVDHPETLAASDHRPVVVELELE